MIKLVNIDNHRLFSDGLHALLASETDMVLLQRYSDGNHIRAMLNQHEPDIILLDMYLNERSGISIAKEIKQLRQQAKIIILSLEVNQAFFAELKEIGVEGYISKELDAEDFIAVIRKVFEGEIIYGDEKTQHSSSETIMKNDFGLTDRELEIYKLIKEGKSSQEIAEILFRSVMTIRTHRKNIRQKLKSRIRNHDGLFD